MRAPLVPVGTEDRLRAKSCCAVEGGVMSPLAACSVHDGESADSRHSSPVSLQLLESWVRGEPGDLMSCWGPPPRRAWKLVLCLACRESTQIPASTELQEISSDAVGFPPRSGKPIALAGERTASATVENTCSLSPGLVQVEAQIRSRIFFGANGVDFPARFFVKPCIRRRDLCRFVFLPQNQLWSGGTALTASPGPGTGEEMEQEKCRAFGNAAESAVVREGATRTLPPLERDRVLG